jgi:hypothetical protein
MYKVAILGCDNSHGIGFTKNIIERHPEIEILGIFGDDIPEDTAKLSEKYGLYVMKSPDEFVGKVDGILITSRSGKTHYEYAKPYIKTGIPMFIDKPVCWQEDEAVEFMTELRDNGVRIMGGSSIPLNKTVVELADYAAKYSREDIHGGYFRCPVDLVNRYGNFYFYAAHLTQMIDRVYGNDVKSVVATQNGKVVTVIFRFDKFDVTGQYVDNNYCYYGSVSSKDGVESGRLTFEIPSANIEIDEFARLLEGGKQEVTYTDFIRPVYTMLAIERALKSGREEPVGEPPVI